ncbi:hypothetical protein P152DRAFT_340342 [Eremomyces bilateralis CBS 781.70]|uniref:UBA domain-containing protein n=1 Tax=Eremomyces bilateralis CBS 781.70 TaxID=1392243 RepID=A0A6G1G3G4_9PEZI|nr:uncharacterized protein P152DRAFT_340342 [Eremomyces bilateralis CBS 781.70]KAF1812471.1 hypothetical protein P152DRAFT_340342 [Eremomyces bilateralis CBS 781.70]
MNPALSLTFHASDLVFDIASATYLDLHLLSESTTNDQSEFCSILRSHGLAIHILSASCVPSVCLAVYESFGGRGTACFSVYPFYPLFLIALFLPHNISLTMEQEGDSPFAPPQPSSPIQLDSRSIFSQRRATTPAPIQTNFVMDNLRRSQIHPPSRSKWASKLGKSHVESKTQGTILRAVPKADMRQTISAPLYNTLVTPSSGSSSGSDPLSAGNPPLLDSSSSHGNRTTHSEPDKRSFSFRSKSRDQSCEPKPNVIGVWRDGAAHWDAKQAEQRPRITIAPATHATPTNIPVFVADVNEPELPPIVPAKDPPRSASAKAQRPRIQLVIPPDRYQTPLPALTYSSQPSVTQAPKSAPVVAPPSFQPPAPGTKTMNATPLGLYTPESQRLMQTITLIPSKLFNNPLERPLRPSLSSSTSEEDVRSDDDDTSNYSHRSSMTSVEETAPIIPPKAARPFNFYNRTTSAAFSIANPVDAGVFENETLSIAGLEYSQSSAKRRPIPAAQPVPAAELTYSPAVSSASTTSAPFSGVVSPLSPVAPRIRRKQVPSSYSQRPLANTNTSKNYTRGVPSPTWSEAQHDLEIHLTAISEVSPFQWDDFVLPERQSIMTPPMTPPRRSSKRLSHPLHLAEHLRPQLATQPPKSCPSRYEVDHRHHSHTSIGESTIIGFYEQTAPSTRSLMLQDKVAQHERVITPPAAEIIIQKIMENLDDLGDLFAAALTNKGFYRVFKRHEMHLIRTVLRKQSPAAWEYLETLTPAHPPAGTTEVTHPDEDLMSPISAIDRNQGSEPESAAHKSKHTPTSYIRFFTRDTYIIAALKLLVLERCQSFLRPTTVAALSNPNPSDAAAIANARAINDAFWRIWTFCRIFGRGRGREDDIIAQTDWLKGGVLAHQVTCTSSIVSNDSFYISSVLLSAAEHFGKGNVSQFNSEEGLSAEELYNMTEIWNCLGTLLHGLQGRTEQARGYGVFDPTDVRGGDIDGEEAMLEEFQYHLLTLGLSPLLTLATCPPTPSAQAFAVAKVNGWTRWTIPAPGGSRSTFLKEAVSRVYEEKLSSVLTPADSFRREMEEIRRFRGKNLAVELRDSKRSVGSSDGAPYAASLSWSNTGFEEERPMSEWEGALDRFASPIATSPLHPVYKVNNGHNSLYGSERHYTPAPQPPSPPSISSSSQSLSHPSGNPSSPPSTPQISQLHPAFRSRPIGPPALRHIPPPLFSQQQRIPRSSPTFTPPPAFHSACLTPPFTPNPTSNHPSAAGPPHRSPPPTPPVPALQHPLQLAMAPDTDPAANSAERAIFRIVEMGFTAEEAKYALRKTDLGDGLRMDRAVELLLRNGGQA